MMVPSITLFCQPHGFYAKPNGLRRQVHGDKTIVKQPQNGDCQIHKSGLSLAYVTVTSPMTSKLTALIKAQYSGVKK